MPFNSDEYPTDTIAEMVASAVGFWGSRVALLCSLQVKNPSREMVMWWTNVVFTECVTIPEVITIPIDRLFR